LCAGKLPIDIFTNGAWENNIMRTTLFSSLIILSLFLSGCNLGQKASPTVTSPQETQPVVDTQATADAEQTAQALATGNAQATSDAGATATVIFEETRNAEETSIANTATQEYKTTATAEAIQQATAAALPMMDALQPLVDEGLISSIEGTYSPLPEFQSSLAKINYIDPGSPTGFVVENFAVKAKFAWNTASDQTNWDRSGCGFIFGYEDVDKYDYFFLGLDGYANLYRPNKQNGQLLPIAKMRYSGKLSIPEGDADVLLVVVDKRIYFFVNGEKVLDAYDALSVPGHLIYTLVSGTNKGFGTSCAITEAGLWQFTSE